LEREHRLTLTLENVNIDASISAIGAKAGLIIDPNTANGSEPASGNGSFNLVPGSVIYLPNVSPREHRARHRRGVLYGDQHPGLAGEHHGNRPAGHQRQLSGTTPWPQSRLPHDRHLECGRGLCPIGNASTRLPARSTGSVTSLAT